MEKSAIILSLYRIFEVLNMDFSANEMKKSEKEIHPVDIYKNPELLANINSLSLRILEYGDVDTDLTWHAEGVCSSFSRLYLVTGGEGFVRVGGEEISLHPGVAYLIPAGLRYSYGTGSHLEKLFFHFNLVRPDGYDYFNRFGRVAGVSLSLTDAAELRRLFYSEEFFAGALTTKLYICRLLSEILAAYPYAPAYTTGFTPRTAAAVTYIREHLRATLTVREIAAALFVSEGTLTGDFKREVGCPVSRYIDDCVLRSAEEQLLCTDRTVSEIATDCGFCDPFYFSRRFHSVFGISPSRYRRIVRTEKE